VTAGCKVWPPGGRLLTKLRPETPPNHTKAEAKDQDCVEAPSLPEILREEFHERPLKPSLSDIFRCISVTAHEGRRRSS